ncbi:MAG: hypothetical protein WDN69_30180 [Aliidongia sp.]
MAADPATPGPPALYPLPLRLGERRRRRGRRLGDQRLPQLPIGVDRILNLLFEVEARRFLHGLAHIVEFGFADHVLDAVLELPRHAASPPDEDARGLQRLGQVLRADHDQGDGADDHQL